MKSSQEFKFLFTPYKIGNVEIKNRMVFQPHVPYFGSIDGYPTESTKRYYIERAKGGVGLIVMESMMVHPTGLYAPGCICLWKKGIVEAFKDLPVRIHEYGARLFGQLSHCGPNTVQKLAQLPYAPSAVSHPGYRTVPKELERDEIAEIVKSFGQGALRLKEAGFDGVELKFAHDGLLKAFASPLLNRRRDEYGGNYENRLRFFRELYEEIRKQVGTDFPVGVRLCIDEFVEGGITQELGVRLAKSLEELGVDYINGDSGSSGDASMQIFPMCVPLGAGVYLASAVKKAVKIPVVAFGRLNDPVLMEMVLEEGHGDFVGSARQFICDPETANKAMEGRLDDIHHCIACNDGCIFRCRQAKPIRCVQNPATGREMKWGIGTLKRTEDPKSIMVIGGGLAGLKFAEIADERGHRVSVYEKSPKLGGQINIAERIPYRAEISEVTRSIILKLQKLNVPVYVNTLVTKEMVDEIHPDITVVATGSTPFVPPISGEDYTKITILNDREALEHPGKIGSHVVVVDRIGHIKAPGICKLALALDAKVHYVTPAASMGVDMDGMTLQHLNLRLFGNSNYSYDPYYEIDHVEKDKVVLCRVFGEHRKEIDCVDTLIVVNQPVSDNVLYKELKVSGRRVYSLGDCNAPRMIEQVIYESERLAREI